jgi:putative ATP-dependent endonuclease of OLD family
MRLTRLQVTNYRSLFGPRVDINLAGGMNSVIGPNNCGKSNLLRALALALDPSFPFDRAIDLPPLGPNTRTRVVCTFEVGSTPPEQTLLARTGEAERALSGKDKTFAQGVLRSEGRRHEAARDPGTARSSSPSRPPAPQLMPLRIRPKRRLAGVASPRQVP